MQQLILEICHVVEDQVLAYSYYVISLSLINVDNYAPDFMDELPYM